MSIRKRLLLTNIGMIVIPIVGFFFIEMLLGYIFFHLFQGSLEEDELNLFIRLRFIIMLIIFVITSGLLTYCVSKSILQPIKMLTIAAKKISEGDLDYRIASERKDELGELTETFDAMRVKLKEAKAAQFQYEQNRKQLIASISHDLKTPLTSIQGYITGMKDGVANTPEKMERYMNTIYKTAHEMNELIDELLLYSQLDMEKAPLWFEKVDLHSFFADFIEELDVHLEKEQGSAVLIADPTCSYIVEADREKLKRAVMNIIQNSLKYIVNEKKEIKVCLSADQDQVIVEIRDNGIGVANEDLPYLFDTFYRTDASRNSSTGGSGLGLAIVKEIIEGHGGEVWAESELGKGTSIMFTLKKVI